VIHTHAKSMAEGGGSCDGNWGLVDAESLAQVRSRLDSLDRGNPSK